MNIKEQKKTRKRPSRMRTARLLTVRIPMSFREIVLPRAVFPGGSPSRGIVLLRGGYTPPFHISYSPPRRTMRPEMPCPLEGTWDQRYPTPCKQTHACENITFPQLRWWAVNIDKYNSSLKVKKLKC